MLGRSVLDVEGYDAVASAVQPNNGTLLLRFALIADQLVVGSILWDFTPGNLEDAKGAIVIDMFLDASDVGAVPLLALHNTGYPGVPSTCMCPYKSCGLQVTSPGVNQDACFLQGEAVD